MSRAEIGKTMFVVCFSASVGAGAGIFSKDAGIVTAAIWVAANLLLALGGIWYWRRAERNEFLDGREECMGGCKGYIRRRELWRLPDGKKMGGVPVCHSCFVIHEQRVPNEFFFNEQRAYASREERWENTKEGKRELRRREKLKKQVQEALSAPVTPADPQSPQSPTHDP
jgi:hypothetical protein